jgi:hypothetical protein
MKAAPSSRFASIAESPAQLSMSSSVPTGVHKRRSDEMAITCQKTSVVPKLARRSMIGPEPETNSSLSRRQSPDGAAFKSTTATCTKNT